MKSKQRIDQVMVELGLAASRQKAQALVMAGRVLVDDQKVDKPSRLVTAGCTIRMIQTRQFASRAGMKLHAALDHFQISAAGRICADLGASTGGFTDCLLQCGAAGVYAFDVGKGQMDWKLRTDPRVFVRDDFNVRYLTEADLPRGLSLVTVDLSFISIRKILSPLMQALGESLERQAAARRGTVNAGLIIDLVILVKPQFELEKGEIGKGGIVQDPAKRARALQEVDRAASHLGYRVVGSLASPVLGAKGNQEFLLYLQYPPDLSSPA